MPEKWPSLVSPLDAKRHGSSHFWHNGREHRVFRLRAQDHARCGQLRNVREGDAKAMKKTMTTVNECLILAAGNGSRIASVSGGAPKPLVPLRGIPLLEHVMTSCQEAGITKFVIVVGYRADLIRRWFAERSFDGISVTLIENP